MGKILILTSDLYQGGVAESSRKIAKILEERHEVIVCSYDSLPIKKNLDCKAKLICLNIPLSANFRSSKLDQVSVKFLRYLLLPLAILKFFFIVIKEKPCAVYSLTYVPNIVNVLSSKLCGVKSIISERQDPREDFLGKKLLPNVLKQIYKKSDCIHVNSYEMIDAVHEFYEVDRNKLYHFDNFFFRQEILDLAKEEVLDYDFSYQPVIITSGRLSKQKGHWHLIDIFSEVLKEKPTARLVFLGDGELKDELVLRCEELGVADSVSFLGNVENPHKYVSRSSLFVFPSIWESFGNSLVEAMSLGVPVASTVCKSGPGTIIKQGEYGVNMGVFPRYPEQIDSRTKEDLASKFISVIDNKEFYSERSRVGYDRFDSSYVKLKLYSLFG